MSFYRMPSFASQIAFEIIRTNDNKKNNRTYSDYLINYYFNDELLLNMTVDEFYKIVELNIWSDDQINAYCNNIKNKTDDDDDDKSDNRNYPIIKRGKEYHLAPLIIFTSLFAVSLLVNIFTISKLLRRNSNKSIPTQKVNVVNNLESSYSYNLKNIKP